MTNTTRAAIQLNALTKNFGDVAAVNELTLEVPSGGVIGLLGPNGAGKSTTIRMLLGLIRPTSGSGEVLGESIKDPASYIHRVGALVESPAFYPKLSGEKNLETIAALDGQPRSRIDEVLDVVGLAGRAGDRVAEYSLGMKQRLGIALALLKDPELLVLDEPTNGLDPAGIVEIRELLKRFAAQGKTVFISSHLLAEVQAVADQVVIINRGQLVFEGSLSSLLKEAAHEVLVVPEQAADVVRLGTVLEMAGFDAVVDHEAIHVSGATAAPGELNRLAFDHGIVLRELRIDDEGLEDVFLRMTDGEMGL